MFHHLILFSFKPHLDERDILPLLSALAALRRDIPQICSCSYGRNDAVNLHNKHYQYGLVMHFATRRDRQQYQCHPLHQQFIAVRIAPALLDAVVLDFEDLAHGEGTQA